MALITALLESGVEKESVNGNNKKPFDLASEAEDELLMLLFTHPTPNKATLLELAKNDNEKEDLVKFLENTGFMAACHREAPALNKKIKKNPLNCYADTRDFYEWHPQAITFAYPTSQNTILHQAVNNYINGSFSSIFEVLVLIERGANKDAANSEGKSPLSLAKESGIQTLIKLMTCEKPSVDYLFELANGDARLSEWLTSVEEENEDEWADIQ